MAKLVAFVVITIMYLILVCLYGLNDKWMGIFYMTLMYVFFILVSLYELGKNEIEKEENENRNNRE
jgi:Ca2+/Na+ antiporter